VSPTGAPPLEPAAASAEADRPSPDADASFEADPPAEITATAEPGAPEPQAGVRPNQRERILDIALGLMSEHGAGATSMRQLAAACGVNVAAIYYYFPSKAELLRSVIEERRYGLRLRELPEVDTTLAPRERLVALILAMADGAMEEEAIWRLLLGEGLRGDETALAVGRELLAALEPALEAWLVELFPPTEQPSTSVDIDSVATVVLAQLFSFFVGQLFRPPAQRDAAARREAEAIATLAFPDEP
jgi:AcrR family transcriptional regulator